MRYFLMFLVGLVLGTGLSVIVIALLDNAKIKELENFVNQLLTENAHLKEWRE